MYQEVKNVYHLLVAILATVIYGFPASRLKVIGVTGTDGKTTTSSLIYHILKHAGKKVALISTVGAYIDNTSYDTGFHVTTPSSIQIQRYLSEARSRGVEFVVLETTSHALDQNRVALISFEVGVITNISHEHLDYHKTYDKYLRAKLKLFEDSKNCILNRDDKSYKQIINLKNKILNIRNKKFMTYGFGQNSTINPDNFKFRSKLIGDFNKYNILAAVAASKVLGVESKKIREAVLNFDLPSGRQEIVYQKEFTVMVDFAHTPNAFAKLLSEISREKKGRLIHVFGSAGERDATKRPMMGEESSKWSDLIILTSEDPRKEKIENINRDIQSGIPSNFSSLVQINNRREAIFKAINMAKRGDFILLTGKSHEKSINLGNGEEPWDEFKVINDALKERGLIK